MDWGGGRDEEVEEEAGAQFTSARMSQRWVAPVATPPSFTPTRASAAVHVTGREKKEVGGAKGVQVFVFM